jgi:hypothetical protein
MEISKKQRVLTGRAAAPSALATHSIRGKYVNMMGRHVECGWMKAGAAAGSGHGWQTCARSNGLFGNAGRHLLGDWVLAAFLCSALHSSGGYLA